VTRLLCPGCDQVVVGRTESSKITPSAGTQQQRSSEERRAHDEGRLELTRSPPRACRSVAARLSMQTTPTTPPSRIGTPPARSAPAPAARLTPSAAPCPPHHSRLTTPACTGPPHQNPPHRSQQAVPARCTEPRRRGRVRYTGVHVSGESLVPLGSGGMPRGMRRFPLSSYRISRPADTVAPGPGAFGCGQSPRSRPTRFRTPGELPSKSVPFENHVGNLAGRSAADVCSKDTPAHRVRQAFRRTA
jgi:hypothetical protein